MPERSLESRYRALVASFVGTTDGLRLAEDLGPRAREAIDLVAFALAHDTALPPREIDREQVRTLMSRLLPGRIAGDEPYRAALPDVLEAFLMHAAAEEGLTTGWEWSSEVDASRDAYAAALRDPKRDRFGGGDVKRTPDQRVAPKIGRNDPCFCGSGKKYKHCCLKLFP